MNSDIDTAVLTAVAALRARIMLPGSRTVSQRVSINRDEAGFGSYCYAKAHSPGEALRAWRRRDG